MKRRIIAIDIDDVIADGSGALKNRVNEVHSLTLTDQDYQVDGDYWGYYERIWASHGLDVSHKKISEEMVIDQTHVPLLPGASFAINQLSRDFDIVIVTARDISWQNATVIWLNGHFGDVFTSVNFAGNKYVVNSKTKGEKCAEVGAEWLIDDNPEHCLTALDAGIDAVLFGSYGWHYNAPHHLTRCKDWPAVLEYFNGVR